MTVAVVRFPGSNCDRDCVWALERIGARAALVWHRDAALPADTTGVVLPGGFSYGDYLRAGAMAAKSQLLADVRRFAEAGGPVLGICNGFQILCEAKLLPGVLLKNRDGLFVCEVVDLDVVAGGKGMLAGYRANERIALPIAHGDGNYYADDAQLDELERAGAVALRYVDRDEGGGARWNGAQRAIAGVIGGPRGNVLGLMPHPERRAETRLGGEDGRRLLEGLVRFPTTRAAA